VNDCTPHCQAGDQSINSTAAVNRGVVIPSYLILNIFSQFLYIRRCKQRRTYLLSFKEVSRMLSAILTRRDAIKPVQLEINKCNVFY